jgi:hypothetical protein
MVLIGGMCEFGQVMKPLTKETGDSLAGITAYDFLNDAVRRCK